MDSVFFAAVKVNLAQRDGRRVTFSFESPGMDISRSRILDALDLVESIDPWMVIEREEEVRRIQDLEQDREDFLDVAGDALVTVQEEYERLAEMRVDPVFAVHGSPHRMKDLVRDGAFEVVPGVVVDTKDLGDAGVPVVGLASTGVRDGGRMIGHNPASAQTEGGVLVSAEDSPTGVAVKCVSETPFVVAAPGVLVRSSDAWLHDGVLAECLARAARQRPRTRGSIIKWLDEVEIPRLDDEQIKALSDALDSFAEAIDCAEALTEDLKHRRHGVVDAVLEGLGRIRPRGGEEE